MLEALKRWREPQQPLAQAVDGLRRKNHELLAELKAERNRRRALEAALLALEGRRNGR